MAKAASRSAKTARRVNLGLQGGGAHGAFTWGVLDRLLEEPDLKIEAISGTSAGAMNGAMVVAGFEAGGAAGARELLDTFWGKISSFASFSPIRRMPWTGWSTGNPWNLDYSISYLFLDALTRAFSPYQFNPLNMNPLRQVLEEVLEIGQLRRCEKIKLFVNATNVRTGKIKVFATDQVSIDCLLASACLPFLFRTVEVDGEPYWDGGYMGNPAIFPLIYNTDCADVVLVQINPLNRAEIPTTAADIWNRVNEISFNSTLMREMRAIAFVARLIEQERLDTSAYKALRIHAIADEAEMTGLGVASKMNAEMDFLLHLKTVGRAAADRWLAQHGGDIGQRSSLDIGATFL
ncbi:MAG: patatin-like phospholipase family protein [Rhodospirillaceae bacterium]|nr:patatin-like phospholipase family protein [Rhodospirillaceae bacterium]